MPQLPPEDSVLTKGVLRSLRYGDIYFSTENGLAEARHVFIQGTGLRMLAHGGHLLLQRLGLVLG